MCRVYTYAYTMRACIIFQSVSNYLQFTIYHSRDTRFPVLYPVSWLNTLTKQHTWETSRPKRLKIQKSQNTKLPNCPLLLRMTIFFIIVYQYTCTAVSPPPRCRDAACCYYHGLQHCRSSWPVYSTIKAAFFEHQGPVELKLLSIAFIARENKIGTYRYR